MILNLPQWQIYSCSQIPFSIIISTSLLSNIFVAILVSILLNTHSKMLVGIRGLMHIFFSC